MRNSAAAATVDPEPEQMQKFLEKQMVSIKDKVLKMNIHCIVQDAGKLDAGINVENDEGELRYFCLYKISEFTNFLSGSMRFLSVLKRSTEE